MEWTLTAVVRGGSVWLLLHEAGLGLGSVDGRDVAVEKGRRGVGFEELVDRALWLVSWGPEQTMEFGRGLVELGGVALGQLPTDRALAKMVEGLVKRRGRVRKRVVEGEGG